MSKLNKKQRVRVSKAMSTLLRHRLETDSAGYVKLHILIDNLKKITDKSFPKINLDLIEDIVTNCKKQRFKIDHRTNGTWVRANQGHSTNFIKSEELLTEIDVEYANDKKFYHGTYQAYIDSIRKDGLSRRSRTHIHITTGLPEMNTVKSGMRTNCNAVVDINVKKAMEEGGIKFFISSNGVILTEGNEDGVIEPKYFNRIDLR